MATKGTWNTSFEEAVKLAAEELQQGQDWGEYADWSATLDRCPHCDADLFGVGLVCGRCGNPACG